FGPIPGGLSARLASAMAIIKEICAPASFATRSLRCKIPAVGWVERPNRTFVRFGCDTHHPERRRGVDGDGNRIEIRQLSTIKFSTHPTSRPRLRNPAFPPSEAQVVFRANIRARLRRRTLPAIRRADAGS